jgi:hypothetical protein
MNGHSTTDCIPPNVQKAMMNGDLALLTEEQRWAHYLAVCQACGLNWITRPFAYLNLQGKLILYALKTATQQLAANHNISLVIEKQETQDDCYMVQVRATDQTGRTDSDVGVVSLSAAKGDNNANLKMKCVTKAKRRVILSMCGLGLIDESELDTIPKAVVAEVQPGPPPRAIPEELRIFNQVSPESAQASAPPPQPSNGSKIMVSAAQCDRIDKIMSELGILPADCEARLAAYWRNNRLPGQPSWNALTEKQASEIESRLMQELEAKVKADSRIVDPFLY